MEKKVILSGIQPSGSLHLGNYFGAMRQHIEWQDKGEAYYFIANYHALTSVRDADTLRKYSLDVAMDYLALGLDPHKCVFFLQSDVPEVTELAWILGTLTPVGLMERGVAYKDKIAQGLSPNIGLFTYPILQAADILIYNSDLVPVGADQKQNIEICRDLAGKFNSAFGEVFKIPEPYILDEVAVVPGTDGRKMSKSYNNTIGIFDSGKTLKKKIMSIVTDSKGLEEPKDPETCNVFALIKLFADKKTQEEIAEKYRAGGYGYGHAKMFLLELVEKAFAEAREKRKEYEQNPDFVMQVLEAGGKKARKRAREIMEKVRSACGILRSH